MATPHYVLDYERMAKREWISVDGVNEDAVDAFVLHIRLLTQDQDGFSIRRLAEDVYSEASTPEDLADRFDRLRTEWREHITKQSLLRHPHAERNLTNGEVFDTLLYGGLAHANADKVQLFCWMTTSGAFSSFVCASFLVSLRLLLDVVRRMHDVNEDLLQRWAR